MTKSSLTTVAAIIAAMLGLLIIDDLIAAALGRWGDLSGEQIAWRFAPLAIGGIVLALIWSRTRRSE